MHFLPLAHDPAGPAPLAKTARLCEFYATNPPPRNGLIKAVVLLVIFSLFFHDFFLIQAKIAKKCKKRKCLQKTIARACARAHIFCTPLGGYAENKIKCDKNLNFSFIIANFF